MAAKDCVDEVRQALGRDATDEEIQTYFERIHLGAEKLRRGRPDLDEAELLRAAADEAKTESLAAAAIQRRNAKLNLVKRLRATEYVQTFDDAARGLDVLLAGGNTPHAGGRLSLAAQQSALRRHFANGLLHEMDAAGLTDMMRDGKHDLLVARELFEINKDGGAPGITGVPAALQAAEIIAKFQKAAVALLNKEGAWIGQYDGYIASTSHDPDLVRRGGKAWWKGKAATPDEAFGEWRRVIEPLLDERTFDGIDAADGAARTAFLRRVWNSLADGVHLTAEGAVGFKDPAFKGPGNIGKALSQGRTLHFKDADSWHQYFQAFGGRSFISHVMTSLDNAANTAALMRVFGSSPKAEFDALHMRLVQDLHKQGKVDEAGRLKNAKGGLDNLFRVLDGSIHRGGNRTAANIGTSSRAIQAMSKLGGVTLSAISDLPLAASELRHQGVGFLEALSNQMAAVFKGRSQGEAHEIADLLLAGMEGMQNHALGRFAEIDGPAGTIAKLTNVFFRLSGLQYWTDAQRAGAEVMMARHLGRHRGMDFAALPERLSRMLDQFNIGEAEWKALNSVDWAKVEDRAFLTPDRAGMIGDAAVDEALAPKLADIRAAAVERVAAAAERLDKLEEELEIALSSLKKMDGRIDDLDEAASANVLEGIERRRNTIGDLRAAVVAMRDGKLSATDVNRRVARETERLARDAQAIGDRGRARVERLRSLVPENDLRISDLEKKIADIDRKLSDISPDNIEDAKRKPKLVQEKTRLETLLDKAKAKPKDDARVKLNARIDRMRQSMLQALDEMAQAAPRLEREISAARDDWRQDLTFKLRAYIADRSEYAVLTPGAREKAWLTQGTSSGTALGEALRFVMQFKAFPVSMISKVWGREVYGGERGWSRAAGMIHVMVGMTAFGYLAMNAKDLFKGQKPRDPLDPKTWLAAMTQGGGAGIYGDFLFGEYNRFSKTLTATALGPTGGMIDDAADLFTRARNGDDMAAAGLRFGLSNTPFANLFYVRPALDYLLLYQMQDSLNPGFLRRMERSLADKTGKTFFIPPSSTMPTGGGDRWFEGVRE